MQSPPAELEEERKATGDGKPEGQGSDSSAEKGLDRNVFWFL